jgi:hypothetical protein
MESVIESPVTDEDARDRRAARRIAYLDAGARLLAAGNPAIRVVACCVTVLLGAQSVPWIR